MKLQLILLSFLFSCISADYYEDLELPFEATAKDIKKAYRKLSLKYHPGMSNGWWLVMAGWLRMTLTCHYHALIF